MASLLSLSLSSPTPTRNPKTLPYSSCQFKGNVKLLKPNPSFVFPSSFKIVHTNANNGRAPFVVLSQANAGRSSILAASGVENVRFRLNNLGPQPGATKKRKRKGRGHAAGQGGSCGFGMRGQKSRSGPGVRPGFEGGQMPLYRRLPKLRGIAGGD